jgi:hypothetical protein
MRNEIQRFQNDTKSGFLSYSKKKAIPNSKNNHFYRDAIEMVHKRNPYWLTPYIMFHLSGIVIAENANKKGIACK